MKNLLNVISRCALAAVATGALCLNGHAFAQEGGAKYGSSPSGTSATSSSSPAASNPEDQPMGAFRPSTNKPSKAELEKQKAEGGNNAKSGASAQLAAQD